MAIICMLIIIVSGFTAIAGVPNVGILREQPPVKVQRARADNNESNITIYYLNGSIEAEWLKDVYGRDQWLGILAPKINLSKNQTLLVRPEFDNTTNQTVVKGILQINVTMLGNASREFLFGRYVSLIAILQRKDINWYPFRSMRKRVFIGQKVFIGDSADALGENPHIDLPFNYVIEENRSMEHVVMHMFSWCIMPGNAIFGILQLPVLTIDTIHLYIKYE